MTFASIKALADAKASEVVMFAAKSHSKRSPSGLAMRVVLGTLRFVLGTSHVRDLAVPAWRERCGTTARRVGRVCQDSELENSRSGCYVVEYSSTENTLTKLY